MDLPRDAMAGQPLGLALILILQRNVGIRGDHLRDPAERRADRTIEVVGAKIRNHLAADIAHFPVRQNAFQAVTHVDAPLAVVHRQQDQNSAIGALLAHVPFVFQAAGVIRDIIAFQRMNGHNRHLGIGLRVVELAADAIQARNRFRREHVGKVADVIGRLGQVLDPFGGENRSESK